jgi:hypothetical protein
MTDLKKQVDDMARDVTDIDPLKGVREDIENVGSDVQRSLSGSTEQSVTAQAATEQAALPEPETHPALPAPEETPALPAATPAVTSDSAPAAPAASPQPEQAAPEQPTHEPHGPAGVEPAGATRTG